MHANTLAKRTETFLKKAAVIHGDSYDYSKVVYVNSATLVIITCPTHGEFHMRPNSHLQGQRCPECSLEAQTSFSRARHSQCKQTFVERAKVVHGDKYCYDVTTYTGTSSPITIKCKLHGEFQVKYAHEHLSGKRGCPTCARNEKARKLVLANTRTNDEFVAIANELHNSLYTYDTNYSGYNTPITITCKKHGPFVIKRAGYHLSELQGCPSCTHKMSKGEQSVASVLDELNIPYVHQYGFDQLRSRGNRKLLFDFFVEPNILIEYDGVQHHTFIPFFHQTVERFDQLCEYDTQKTKFALNEGYILIRVDANNISSLKCKLHSIIKDPLCVNTP